MKITDTQQAAQYSASAAVSAAEAKQYLLSIEQPIIDIEGSVSDAKDAAILSRQAMEEAKAISSGLSESIDFEIAAKEAEFESQMQDQRSKFESAQQAKENDFISSQTQMESEFEASQANKESRFQEFLDSSGYVFLGDYENGQFQFSARNQYIRYNNQYYRLNAATDVGFTTTGTDASSFANDVAHFVLMDGDTLRQNLGSGEGFKWVGQFSSVASLAATPGGHGDRVLVKSYNDGGSEGGGQFVYDEARAAENNGVTVFNGWVRQIVNNTLTNYDAGIIPFDGSDATSRLSALFNNAPDGTHLYIIGHHQISGPVTIKGKNALTFHSDYGAISGYERRESWVWGADSDFEYGSGNLGILSFFNCHKIIVDGLFIDGAHLQRPDSKEWGDCMVRYEHCTYMTIRNCKGDGFGGWGIFGLYSDYADIHNNVISRVSRQSGINAFACSSYSKVYNNTLNDVSLYGVEFETFDSKADSVTYGNQAYNNEIRGAKFGLTVVGNHNDALIYSNKCYGCQTGVFAIKYTGKNIVIRDNSILDCMRGVQVNASKNVLTLRNTLTVNEVPAFVIDDQYNAVLDITADRMAFYSINSVRAGYQIQIRGVTYTVASSVQDPTRTDYQAQSGGLYLNTLTTALAADVEHCDNVYVSTTSLGMTPYGFGLNVERSSSTITDSSSNNRFISNIAAGKVAAGCFTNSVYTDVSAIKEWWIDNQTSPSTDNPYTCRWMRFNQGANAAINVQGARHDKLSSIFSSATNGSTLNIFGNRILQYGSNLAVASGGQFPPHYYISERPFAIVSIKVVLTNFSSSEDVYLRINGTESMVKVADANASETAVVSYTSRKLFFTLSTVGLMYFRLATASNTAKVSGYSIEIEIM